MLKRILSAIIIADAKCEECDHRIVGLRKDHPSSCKLTVSNKDAPCKFKPIYCIPDDYYEKEEESEEKGLTFNHS